jgi:hypothetical protein
MKRRHLNESQRAMAAAEIANLKRGNVAARKSELQICSSQPVTTEEAADMLNVGVATVYQAKKVLKEATPEEIEAVKQGQAAVGTVAVTEGYGVSLLKRRGALNRRGVMFIKFFPGPEFSGPRAEIPGRILELFFGQNAVFGRFA